MPADLRQRWRRSSPQARPASPAWGVGQIVRHTDHQNLVGTQMQRRADGRLLAHSPIAEPLAVEQNRGKYQRNGRRRHQVLQPQPRLHTYPPVPRPGRDPLAALIEIDRLGRLIAKCTDRYRLQQAGLQRLINPAKVQGALQQSAQRRVIQQGRRLPAWKPQQVGLEPAPGLSSNARPVCPVHLVTVKTGPDRIQTIHPFGKVLRMGRQRQRVDCARRRAADDRKGVRRALRQQLGDDRQYADLIGRTGTASRQDQPGAITADARIHQLRRARRLRRRRLAYGRLCPSGRVLKRRCTHMYCSGCSRTACSTH